MTTAVIIFLVGAVLGIPIALGIYSDRGRELIWQRQRTTIVDHVALDEIRAGITVYDFVDGREVNRRAAYPIARFRRELKMADAMKRLGEAAKKMSEAFERMFDDEMPSGTASPSRRRDDPRA